MADGIHNEKPQASAPPPYSEVNPSGQASQYGFQVPVNQQSYPPGYPQQSFPTGYPPQPYLQGYSPNPYLQHPSNVVNKEPSSTNQQTVIIMGGCPSCRVGVLEDDYTCCGILCAICFFPIGILCCLAMKEKRCTSCKATF